jgi:alginate O-acetyltransferase complex protein AlgI
MLFNSVIFLFVFFPVILIGWYGLKDTRIRLVFMTLMSFVFYGYWDYRFVFLMLASIVLDYYVGNQIHAALSHDKKKAKRWLLVSVFANLGALAFFKYFNFFLDTINAFLPPDDPIKSALEVVLPVGISFYTFQSMSYSLDIYRGKAKPTNSLLHFSAYVSMFPQLIAGPIVRYSALEQQLREVSRKVDWNRFYDGIFYFTAGLFRKLFIADFFAIQAEFYFSGNYEVQFIGAWVGVLCYTFQIYFDFSAYSEMAIGLGKMLGFEFPVNFNSPYKAKSFSDYWRRWHITLSEFLRDYLYIPLGGNRKGNLRTYVNLSATMLLGGLWHGASWMFVIWGAIHGLFLSIERLVLDYLKIDLGNKWLWRYVVFIIVCFAWVFFRADSFDFALQTVQSMALMNGIEPLEWTYNFHGVPLPEVVKFKGGVKVFLGLAAGLVAVRFMPNTQQIKIQKTWWFAVGMAVVLFICLINVDKPSPFIYFRF